MARGCQVQGHSNVEGQCEDWEVPLAEDGVQGTGQDGAGGRNITDPSDATCLDTRPHGGGEPWLKTILIRMGDDCLLCKH